MKKQTEVEIDIPTPFLHVFNGNEVEAYMSLNRYFSIANPTEKQAEEAISLIWKLCGKETEADVIASCEKETVDMINDLKYSIMGRVS